MFFMPNLQPVHSCPSLALNYDKDIIVITRQPLTTPWPSMNWYKTNNQGLPIAAGKMGPTSASPALPGHARGALPLPTSHQLAARTKPISPLTRTLRINNDIPGPLKGDPSNHEAIIKPSLTRYIVLILYCINSANKAFQWIQIPAATKKLTYFYGVENFVINSMSVIFMLTFLVASWPACYMIKRIGIRKAVVMASFGTSLGSLIKCFSCHEHGIYLLFIGQTLVSTSEQLIFSVPSRLASVWFPDHQVSSAVAISVLGSQLGIALGFVVPQFALDEAETREAIGDGLQLMFIGTAVFSFGAFVASFMLFDEAPRYAPGAARLKQIEEERKHEVVSESFMDEMRVLAGQIRHLLVNKHFNLLAISYGFNIGIGYTLSTVLNQMLEPLWPKDDLLIGNTGFIIIMSGAVCSPLWGRLLDKMHRYLIIYNLLTLATIGSLLTFAFVLSGLHSKAAIYLAAALFGSFQTGLLITGLELAVELTYPAAELVTSSFMNMPPQIFGTIFVFISSYLVDSYGTVASNLFLVLCYLAALIMILNITETLKRQNAVSERKNLPLSIAS